MDLLKLYCIHTYPDNWMQEYEDRTGILSSLDALDRFRKKHPLGTPRKIMMTPKQLAEYRKRMAVDVSWRSMTPVGNKLYYMGCPVEVKK